MFMTDCLSDCWFLLAGLCKILRGWIILKESEDGSWSNSIPLDFESGLDYCLDAKQIIQIFLFTNYYAPRWGYALQVLLL